MTWENKMSRATYSIDSKHLFPRKVYVIVESDSNDSNYHVVVGVYTSPQAASVASEKYIATLDIPYDESFYHSIIEMKLNKMIK